MTLSEQTEKRVYEKLRAFDGLEVAGHEPVDSSIASVLSEGEVLADDGNQYSSIQDAVDASDGWTFVGPGTYYENVTINKDDFMLQGAGYNTLIDGGVTHSLETLGNNVNINSIKFSGGADNIVTISGNNTTITNCKFTGAGFNMFCNGNNLILSSSKFDAIRPVLDNSEQSVISNNHIDNAKSDAVSLTDADNSIVVNNIIKDAGRNSISILSTSSDCVIGGNRIHNSTEDGIADASTSNTDCIIFNNRISGSGLSDLDISGSGTVVEGNLTGG